MRNAQILEVGGYPSSIIKIERTMKLKPVRRRRGSLHNRLSKKIREWRRRYLEKPFHPSLAIDRFRKLFRTQRWQIWSEPQSSGSLLLP